jgi:hypothetical protein
MSVDTSGTQRSGAKSAVLAAASSCHATPARRGIASSAGACRRGRVGKVAVAIAPSNPRRVYALIETGNGAPWRGQETDRGVVWRSDDGVDTWHMVSADWNAVERPHYYSRLPSRLTTSTRCTFWRAKRLVHRWWRNYRAGDQMERWPGADHHDMWIDPTDPSRMIVGHDLGLSISIARGGRTWRPVILPIAQMYPRERRQPIPYYVYGNRQDGPGYRGPSNSRRGASAEVPITASGSGGDVARARGSRRGKKDSRKSATLVPHGRRLCRRSVPPNATTTWLNVVRSASCRPWPRPGRRRISRNQQIRILLVQRSITARNLLILNGVGEPGRNRTFNQQIKRTSSHRPPESASCFPTRAGE